MTLTTENRGVGHAWYKKGVQNPHPLPAYLRTEYTWGFLLVSFDVGVFAYLDVRCSMLDVHLFPTTGFPSIVENFLCFFHKI